MHRITPESFAAFLLRLGVALAFLYPPFAAISDPYSWEGYFPAFMHSIPVDPLILLHGFGVIEVVLALWLLSGKYIRIPAALMTVMLVAIVAFNWADFPVLFRDLSIATVTLALAIYPRLGRAS